MSKRVVTFGEIMLRLKSPGFERLFQSPTLEATFGGGEANVAVSLANYGLNAAFVSVLPKNDIGEAAITGEPLAALVAQREHLRPFVEGVQPQLTESSQRWQQEIQKRDMNIHCIIQRQCLMNRYWRRVHLCCVLVLCNG